MKSKINNKKIKELRSIMEYQLSDTEAEEIINLNKDKILSKIYCATQSSSSCAAYNQSGQLDPSCQCCSSDPGA